VAAANQDADSRGRPVKVAGVQRLLFLLVSALLAGAPPAPARVSLPGAGGALNAALAKIFADAPPFTADSDTSVEPAGGGTKVHAPMKFAVHGGRLRFEVDVARLRGPEMPAQVLANLQRMGMDHMVTVTLPAERKMLVVYPALSAFTHLVLPAEQLPDLASLQLTARPDGAERVNGQPCAREQFTLTGPHGLQLEGVLWRAQDEADLPVRVRIPQADGVVTLDLMNVKRARAPDAAIFGPPAGYREFADMQALTLDALKRADAGKK
jgi:hypothetical protein